MDMNQAAVVMETCNFCDEAIKDCCLQKKGYYCPSLRQKYHPSKACVSVVISLCLGDVSLPESAENKIIFSPRVSFACITHSVSKIS